MANSLATNPEFADAFVEQAKLDALLGEIYRDQRSSQMHDSLATLLTVPQPLEKSPEPKVKIVRGPFPYWKQVAAILLAGLFLWAISGLWQRASSDQVVKKGHRAIPTVQSAVAMNNGSPKPAHTPEDRELEAWLKGYFVDAQPATNQPLEAWLKLLVEHEFPLHNHLNKHRALTWEIRGKDTAEQNQLAQQSLQAQCSAASLFTQIQGIAALAGCELHVETDKLVLTPMKESSSGTETREMLLAEAFAQGAGVVRPNAGIIIVRDFPYPTEFEPPQIPQNFGTKLEDPQDSSMNISGVFPVTPSTPLTWDDFSSDVAQLQIKDLIPKSGVEWPASASVGEVAVVESDSLNFAYQNANQHYWFFQPQIHSGQTKRLFKTTITTSPKGLRQLEILSSLTTADESRPNVEVTSYTFPSATAPNETDRVATNEEIAPLVAAWQPQASVVSVSVNPSPMALPGITTLGNVITWERPGVDDLVQERITQRLDRADTNGDAVEGFLTFMLPPAASDVNGIERFIIPQVTQARTANLNFTRSGELVKISGSINEHGTDRLTELPELLGRTDVAPVPTADTGVDLSLGLFPGQTAIVKGPATNGTASYYVLKLAK